MTNYLLPLLEQHVSTPGLMDVAKKTLKGKRITEEDALLLYLEGDLPFLSILSSYTRKKINDNNAFFNRNFHIEPTNICLNRCSFCSFRREKGEKGSWESDIDDILLKAEKYVGTNVSEVHIVGGVHPERDIHFYTELIGKIKSALPDVHIKAFTAVEIDHMINISNVSLSHGLSMLKNAGVGSLPGGGAEIFDEKLRRKICPEKIGSLRWLEIHEEAHKLDIPSNSTMLYGLLENYEQRIAHMTCLRNLQDRTNGFNAFIPLKFKHHNNAYSHVAEATLTEDMKNYAISRLFLDNIPHIKAYWPMTGKTVAQLSLSFGVDDLDGTIDDSTKIYSMAGSDEQSPTATTEELINMISQAGYTPTERDTLYNIIKCYD